MFYALGKIGKKVVYFTGGGFTVTKSRTKAYQSIDELKARIKVVNKAHIKSPRKIPKGITIKTISQDVQTAIIKRRGIQPKTILPGGIDYMQYAPYAIGLGAAALIFILKNRGII